MKSVGAVERERERERERESYNLRNEEKLKDNNVTRGIFTNGSIFDAKKQESAIT